MLPFDYQKQKEPSPICHIKVQGRARAGVRELRSGPAEVHIGARLALAPGADATQWLAGPTRPDVEGVSPRSARFSQSRNV